MGNSWETPIGFAAKPEQIIIQFKGGKIGVKDVRDLRGVLDRKKAASGRARHATANRLVAPKSDEAGRRAARAPAGRHHCNGATKNHSSSVRSGLKISLLTELYGRRQQPRSTCGEHRHPACSSAPSRRTRWRACVELRDTRLCQYSEPVFIFDREFNRPKPPCPSNDFPRA